jgi:hypothetical protein
MTSAISALALLLLAGGIWFVFLRPVPRRVARGVIVGKKFKPATKHVQYPEGGRAPKHIPIAECYVFTVQVDGEPSTAAYSLNTTAAEPFAEGQAVDIVYEVRGIPGIWKAACILEMKRA